MIEMEYCKHCGIKRTVDTPPFEEMTEQDIEDWRNAGGQVVLLECINGCP